MKKVLFVVSAADTWTLEDGSTHPTGYWAEELATPHRLFSKAGWDITIATPGGVAPTVDKTSLGLMGGMPWKTGSVEEYLESIKEQLDNPVALDQVNGGDYDVIFYPGGHGPMEDLAYDATSGALLRKRLDSGKPLGLLCHAPAAVLASTNEDGSNAFAGYKMTGFSNAEEKVNPASRKAKWLLEDRLEEAGIEYDKGLPMLKHVVVDRNVYTGQNPASSEELAEKLIEAAS